MTAWDDVTLKEPTISFDSANPRSSSMSRPKLCESPTGAAMLYFGAEMSRDSSTLFLQSSWTNTKTVRG